MLSLGATVPAKKALVDQALTFSRYSGSVVSLARAWNIAATTIAEVYAAKPMPPRGRRRLAPIL